jgi:hypothetical protein
MAKTPPTEQEAPANPGPDGASAAAPSNPAAANVSPPEPSISGNITVGPIATEQIGFTPIKPPPPPATTQVQLLRVDVLDSRPVIEPAQVASLARGMGGIARELTSVSETSELEASGVLVLLDEAKVETFVEWIKQQQPNVFDVAWRGDSDSRQAKLLDEPQKQLDALEKKRRELLMKYYEDATPVKVVDEAIEKLKITIGRLRIGPKESRLAAIRVTFRAKA